MASWSLKNVNSISAVTDLIRFSCSFCTGYVDDFNYDTFVYDIINDQPSENNDLFIHLEDIFGGGHSTSWFFGSCVLCSCLHLTVRCKSLT